jgi:AMMECR1 domain-containing protein
MKELVAQILEFYFTKMREPKLTELKLESTGVTQEKGCCFVSFYINGEVHGSAWNVKEIHSTLTEELISNTIQALTGDKRFPPLTLEQTEKIQYRIDRISERKIVSQKDLSSLDPVKSGIIAIKRDYDKLGVILPNMSAKLLTGDDFTPVMLAKLDEKKLDDKNYILYEIKTEVETNY